MLFMHLVVYTVKELDSHAKHGQSLKDFFWTYNSISVPKSHFRVRTSFREFFFDCCSWWRKRRWNSLYGISPGRTRPCMHRPERERERDNQPLHSAALHGTRSGRMSLKKCFWLWEKDNLVQLPKTTHRYVNSGYSLFFGGSNGVSQVFCWWTFYKQDPIRCWICTSFDTERWSGPRLPATKDPGHDSELQMVSEMASNVSVLLAIGASAHHSLAPPTRHASRSSAFFGENRKSVSFFYKYDKTKDFLEIWRMHYSIGTQY